MYSCCVSSRQHYSFFKWVFDSCLKSVRETWSPFFTVLIQVHKFPRSLEAQRTSVSEWLPLNMQSRGKHVHPAAGLGRQITSGSLIHWSLERPNWIMGSEVKCACMCVHVQVCLIRQAGPCWVTVLLCPLYLGPSVSIRRDDRHSSFSRDPSPLGHRRPHVYSITLHYLVSAWRHHLRTRQRLRAVRKREPILFLLRFLLIHSSLR